MGYRALLMVRKPLIAIEMVLFVYVYKWERAPVRPKYKFS